MQQRKRQTRNLMPSDESALEYIVFDLEWNQCPQGKGKGVEHFPFEIIEIGAIKLNAAREIIDEFQVVVKPQVYKWIHSRTREVIHVNYKSLRNGVLFPEAVQQFLDWCGENRFFCSWGEQDLMELQRNLKFYHLEGLLKGPIPYYNIQKLFSIECEDGKSRKALEHGIDYFEIPKEREFHRALTDAWYTAAIFQKLDLQVARDHYSVDVFQNPQNKKEELHIFYKEYAKYVSREFPSKEQAIRDREVASTKCPYCHKAAKRTIRWFAANQRHYYSVSLCAQHGYVKGKVRIKKAESGNIYAVKTLKIIDEEAVREIRERQESLRIKRQLKRRAEKLAKNR